MGGICAGRDGKLLELRVSSGEKIVGAELSCENKAAVWTEKGNIFILTVKANHYWKLGKPGLVKSLKFVAGDPDSVLVGLKTKKLLVIDTETGAIKRRLSESEDILSVGSSGDVLQSLTSHHLTLFSYRTGLQLLRSINTKIFIFWPSGRSLQYSRVTGTLILLFSLRFAVWFCSIIDYFRGGLRGNRKCKSNNFNGCLSYLLLP